LNIKLNLLRWFSPLLALGQKKPLDEDDLYKTMPEEETEYLTNKLEKYSLESNTW
jgi:hypothetical protein